MNTHEDMFARPFITPAKRARFTELFASRKGRKKVLAQLHHIHDLDDRYAHLLRSEEDSADAVLRILRTKGAPAECYVFSEDEDIDGKEFSLEAAISRIRGTNYGAVVSCIPGRLAFVETEDIQTRYILAR